MRIAVTGASGRIGGEDPWWIYAYSSMFASIRDQRWAAVSADTEHLTGHPPAPVRTVLARHNCI